MIRKLLVAVLALLNYVTGILNHSLPHILSLGVHRQRVEEFPIVEPLVYRFVPGFRPAGCCWGCWCLRWSRPS